MPSKETVYLIYEKGDVKVENSPYKEPAAPELVNVAINILNSQFKEITDSISKDVQLLQEAGVTQIATVFQARIHRHVDLRLLFVPQSEAVAA